VYYPWVLTSQEIEDLDLRPTPLRKAPCLRVLNPSTLRRWQGSAAAREETGASMVLVPCRITAACDDAASSFSLSARFIFSREGEPFSTNHR
jgi:hypothetical protein